jgi:prepilin-type N-terminal cleavage/methylation domain-containing protein
MRRQPAGSARLGVRIRRGFTLLELILVLAVIVAVLSMVTPFLQRSFSVQTLKGAADQVRASFGSARARAIKTGNVYAFLYTRDADTYTLAPFINAYSLINPQVLASVQSPPPLDRLPKGLTFVGSVVSQDARAQFESEGAAAITGGMTPILFYPDGTSQDAALLIQNSKGDQIRIDLRGLTGLSNIVRVSQPD